MANSLDTDKSRGGSKKHRLWIDKRWYIPVNDEGVCIGTCAEGALGFVIKLESDREGEALALKIPRLMGETHRENAYISDLMEKELCAVEKVVYTEGDRKGLLSGTPGPLRGTIDTTGGTLEAEEWDGAIIFVRFEKSKNPRFCLVKKGDRKAVKIFPPKGDLPKIADIFDELERCAKGYDPCNPGIEQKNWSQPVFIIDVGEVQQENGEIVNDKLAVFSIEHAIATDPVGKTWYACLPSIKYGWAQGTLQEAISLGRRGGNWDISKHFDLIKIICSGLNALHSREMLHADLRPANIVYQDDPKIPGNYAVSDYGSFAKTSAPTPEHFAATGRTLVGTPMGGERVSAFYAPERRAGREREAANIAVILYPGGGDHLYVVLGWQSDLIEEGKPKKEVVEPYAKSEVLEALEEKSHHTRLQDGDRIQIREYIFDVIKEWNDGDKQILECHVNFSKLYHGRIVVESKERFRHLEWFPIPRTVELFKWSTSIDLYSLGAIALYSIFSDTYRSNKEENILKDDLEKRQAQSSSSSSESTTGTSNVIEEDFREMLKALEGKHYFNIIWLELEWLRQVLENALKEIDSAETLANHEVKRPEIIRDKDQAETLTLKKEVKNVVGRITQTVPGAKDLVEAFDNDLGPFIFFIHFVLCCLHHESNIDNRKDPEWQELMEIMPFSKDRHEPPQANGAAARALGRLETILKYIIGNPLLSGLRAESADIPPFDPRPAYQIRIELQKTQEELKQTQTERKTLIDERDTIRSESQNEEQTIHNLLKTIKDDIDTTIKTRQEWFSGNKINQILEGVKKKIVEAEHARKSPYHTRQPVEYDRQIESLKDEDTESSIDQGMTK